MDRREFGAITQRGNFPAVVILETSLGSRTSKCSSFKHPIVSVPEARKLTGTTYPAANDLMSRFEKHGILREITGQTRNRRFRCDDYVHLFDAD